MSNERDELIQIIWDDAVADRVKSGKDFRNVPVVRPKVEAMANRILAAGYRKPRTITSIEELKTLEDPALILMDYCGHPYQWGESLDGSEGWMAPHDLTQITSNHLWRFTPLTVLYEPEPQP